ncbi:hypothetical protein ACFXTN_017075 [Malus domestica]
MPWSSHSCRYKAPASITNTNLSVIHIGLLTPGARAPRKTAFAGEICLGSDCFFGHRATVWICDWRAEKSSLESQGEIRAGGLSFLLLGPDTSEDGLAAAWWSD